MTLSEYLKILNTLNNLNNLVNRKSLNDGLITFSPGSIESRSIIAIGVNGYSRYDFHPFLSEIFDVNHRRI
jgi:hypothetical protein